MELTNENIDSQISRIILFAFCVGIFVFTMIWEFSLNWFFSMNYSKYLQKEDEKVSRKLKNSYIQKTTIEKS